MIGRPDKSEAAPRYFTYIDQVNGDDPVSALESQVESSVRLFSGISENTSLARYEPGKWSIRQTLNHITDTERIFAFRGLWFARGFKGPLPGYDQDAAVASGGGDSTLWSAHIEEFQNVRLSTISLFRSLPQEAWTRTGIADGNFFTVRALGYIIAGHLEHHLAVLRERHLPADSIQL